MFEKMKQLMEMQKNMQEVKRQLENTVFDITSSDGLVKITMNAAQDLKNISIQSDLQGMDKFTLEESIKDAYNRAVKHAREAGAQKLKSITGMNIPGLT